MISVYLLLDFFLAETLSLSEEEAQCLFHSSHGVDAYVVLFLGDGATVEIWNDDVSESQFLRFAHPLSYSVDGTHFT